jgi:hypothetical protein
MRKEQAQITTRTIAGDVDLVRAILAQKDRLSPELRAMPAQQRRSEGH